MAQHKARESFPSVLEDSDVRQYWAGLTIYVTCYVTGFLSSMCVHATYLIIFLLFLWDSIYSSSSVALSSSKMRTKLPVLPVLGQG